MKLLFAALFCLSLSTSLRAQDSSSSDALRECGNLHHLEFQNLPNSKGEFSNEGCTLKCEVGDKILSQDALNEGFPCPADSNGICESGHCRHTATGVLTDAQRECGNLHHTDFHNHSQGTTFLNSQCELKCVLNGVTVSENSVNEGFPCPAENDKTCRSGKCVTEHSTPLTSAPAPTTTPKPTSGSHPESIFNTMKLDQIRLLLISGNFTEAHSYLQAVACIQPSHDPILELSACSTTYATQSIADSVKIANWRLVSYIYGPFAPGAHIAISVFYTQGGSVGHLPTKKRIGTFVRNIETLADQYYPMAQHTTRDHKVYFMFENRWPVYADSNGAVIGELDLLFDVTLAPKN